MEKTKKIIVYTTKTCPWCITAKEFLKSNKVSYEELDVGENERARNQMIEKSGQLGVPVIEINGKVIVGFDKTAIAKALGM